MPGDTSATVPRALIVATVGFADDQFPPIELSVSAVAAPRQALAGPVMLAGVALTVTGKTV